MNGGGKVPAMVFFDGLDVTKEIQYLKGVADLAERHRLSDRGRPGQWREHPVS